MLARLVLPLGDWRVIIQDVLARLPVCFNEIQKKQQSLCLKTDTQGQTQDLDVLIKA